MCFVENSFLSEDKNYLVVIFRSLTSQLSKLLKSIVFLLKDPLSKDFQRQQTDLTK